MSMDLAKGGRNALNRDPLALFSVGPSNLWRARTESPRDTTLSPGLSPNSAQAGAAMLFFAMIILPLLAVLMSITLDLGLYFRTAQDVQKSLDEAGMYANQFVPFHARVSSAATDHLRSTGLVDQAQVTVSDRGIEIVYNKPFPLNFPQLLGLNVSLPIALHTRVRHTPVDAFVAFDVGSYMAPPARISGGQLSIVTAAGPPVSVWGDQQEFPASAFAISRNGLHAPYCNVFSGQDAALCRRLLTQQCFNPALLEIKQAAVALFEFHANSAVNGAGVGFFPSSANGYLKSLREPKPGTGDVFQPYFLDNPETASVFDGGTFVSTADCSIIADYAKATGQDPLYQFPAPNDELVQPDDPSRPQYIIDPNSRRPDLMYLERLRAREAIWSVVARSPAGANPVVGDTADIMLQAFAAVATAAPVVSRGGLVNHEVKKIFLILGGMPRMVSSTGVVTVMADYQLSDPVAAKIFQAAQQIATAAEQYNLRVDLEVLIMGHDGSLEVPAAADDDDDAYSTLVASYAGPFGATIGSPALIVKVHMTKNPSSLNRYLVNRATDLRAIGVMAQ